MIILNTIAAKTSFFLTFVLIGTLGISSNTLAQQYTPGNSREAPRLVTGGTMFSNCTEMQKHFNSLNWKVDNTTFTGFENRKKINSDGWGDGYVTDEICAKGYQIEKSELGTLVCAGNIVRRGTKHAPSRHEYTFDYANSNKRDSCRYRD
jgi:hypothetical protein